MPGLQRCLKGLSYASSPGSALCSQAEGSRGKGKEQGPKLLGGCLSSTGLCLGSHLPSLPAPLSPAHPHGGTLRPHPYANTDNPILWLSNGDESFCWIASDPEWQAWEKHCAKLWRLIWAKKNKYICVCIIYNKFYIYKLKCTGILRRQVPELSR